MSSFIITLFISILALSSFVTGQTINDNKVIINTKQPESLIDLMHYLKNNFGNYYYKDLNNDSIEKGLKQNYNNIILIDKIDSLLNNNIYSYYSQYTKAYYTDKTFEGKEAYRFAFISLPWLMVNLSAGLNERIVNYFTEENEYPLQEFINLINENKNIYRDSAYNILKNYLPPECITNDTIKIYLGIDGNRGSFADSNYIVIELLTLKKDNYPNLLSTLAHELHHIYYENFLNKKYSDITLNNNEKVLFELQYRILLEGTAQFCNFNTYPDKIKELYSNKELLSKIFELWVKSLSELEKSDDPEKYINNFNKFMYNDFGKQLLKEYSGMNIKELMPYRPTIEYYIGYNIFKTIFDNQGKTGLYNAILNPELLPEIYNHLRNENDVVPQIPNEIVAKWSSNLNKAKLK